MKKNLLKKSIVVVGILSACNLNAQISFTNKNNLLHSETAVLGSNTNVRSGNSVAVVDVNFDGLDDIVKLDGNRYVRIEYQQIGGTFTHVYIGDFGVTSGWGMSMADVDHNGYKDILYAGWGGGGAQLMKLNATGTGVLSHATLPGGAGIAGQNCNFMDVNNDGWEDIFVCNDVDESMIWVNDGTGNFPAEQANSVINFNVTPGVSATPDEYDESGNYGSVWTDFDNDGDVDFYIAHCRQAYGPGDLRRTNVLFENNGNGTYTSNAAAHGLASNDQDWKAKFGDIDNDGDFDVFMTKHDVISRYYINNGGNFTISPNTIAFGSMPMQAQFEDFDNDGFVDLFISGDNDERMYRNNGNATFTDVTPTNLANGGNVLAFASGDLNHDGKIDLYASYGGTYNNPSTSKDDIYWQNSTTNANHFLTLNLTSAVSNKSGLGARAFIYGAWGVQTREVRASESYGTLNSFQLHFGLGATTAIDSVVVNWPSGVHTVIATPAADQFLNVFEQNPCTLSGASVSPSGPQSICSGNSVTLTANATGSGSGYTYLWSNGATTQSITVNTSGSYAVTVRENAQCQSTTSSIVVTVNPVQTPTIAAAGETNFCQGDSVLLTSTAATSYLWSNGATTQNIYATQSGTYSVTTQGLCQQWSSNSVAVSVNPAPAPTSTDVTLSAPATTTLTATGNSVSWYTAPTGGTLLGSGATYNTAMVNTDTVFYAQDSYNYGGGTVSGGKKYKNAGGYSGNNNNEYDVFVADTNCILKTVKVYTDVAGIRTIELRSATGVVLQSVTVNIPVDSSIVTLNFNLTQGTTYRLGTNSAQNNTTLGFTSPRLIRNNGGTAYPYTTTFGGKSIVRATTSSQGTGFYYYFYDWQIELPPTTCVSERTPVHVFLNPVGLKSNVSSDLVSIYPNPTSDFININLNAVTDVELEIVDMLGKKVYTENYTSNGAVKSIATSNFRKGAYEITIKAKGTIYQHKLIIQ